jgi:hypothetical protein
MDRTVLSAMVESAFDVSATDDPSTWQLTPAGAKRLVLLMVTSMQDGQIKVGVPRLDGKALRSVKSAVQLRREAIAQIDLALPRIAKLPPARQGRALADVLHRAQVHILQPSESSAGAAARPPLRGGRKVRGGLPSLGRRS